MTQALDRRRANLRILADLSGGPVALSKRLGYANASYVVQMYAPEDSKWSRPVTEKRARAIEAKLGLPADLMNEPSEHFAKMAQQFVKRGAPAAASADPEVPPARIVMAPQQAPGQPPLVASVAPDAAEMASRALQVVGQVLENEGMSLPPLKFANVAQLTISDAAAHEGVPREEYVQQLVRLMK
jgi:hypothetical protein